jgi:hypothetical protein
LILVVLFRPRRGRLCAAGGRIRYPNRLPARFFIRLVKFFRSPWRSWPQSPRRVIGHLDRRGQKARDTVNDRPRRRVNDRPREHEGIERYRKWGRPAMSYRSGLGFREEGKYDRDRAEKKGGPASSRGAGCKAHASEISCSRANPIIFSIRCRRFEPPRRPPMFPLSDFRSLISDL